MLPNATGTEMIALTGQRSYKERRRQNLLKERHPAGAIDLGNTSFWSDTGHAVRTPSP